MPDASELRTRLQRIETEIARVELSLRSLQEARTAVLEDLRRLIHPPSTLPLPAVTSEDLRRSLTYPVLTLPFEITSQIFLDCLPDEPCSYPSQDEAPLVLTRVCRDWRIVAISTSRLWDHLRVELDSDDGIGYIDEKWVALLDLWLQRSQSQPLSLAVSNRSYTNPDGALLTVLASHARRWRDVTLKLPFTYLAQLEEPASLPLLERLTLSGHGAPNMIHPISAFKNAPFLYHVCFEAGMHPSDVNLPWNQLTSVESYGSTADDCLELLHLVPNVVSCVLDIQYDSHALSLGSPLLALQSFTFSGPASWATLRYLAIPALQTLDLSRCPLWARHFPPLVQFLQRSECQLRELKIYVRINVATQTTYLLHLIPTLSALDLILAEADTCTAILREFKSGVSRVLLPLVETISVHCMHDENYEGMFDVITDTLQIRLGFADQPSNSRLKSFALSMDTSDAAPSAEIRRRWQALVDRGLELRCQNARERWI
ncbi:hypothetical protein C8R47DRAFT_1119850 [Mycena vitilis]|nr:hypothetical protein C8R47DRAFT_1119850 [Mycena vitilis]